MNQNVYDFSKDISNNESLLIAWVNNVDIGLGDSDVWDLEEEGFERKLNVELFFNSLSAVEKKMTIWLLML